MIQTIFKSDSEKSKNYIEKFYFASSKKFFDILAENNLLFIYNSDLYTTALTDEQKEILSKKDRFRIVIDEFSESEYNYIVKHKEDYKENEEFNFSKIFDLN